MQKAKTNNTKNQKSLNEKQLLTRGWTRKLINLLLPPADYYPHLRYRGKAKAYKWKYNAVIKAEDTSTFKTHIQSLIARKEREYSGFLEKQIKALETSESQPRALEFIASIERDTREIIAELGREIRSKVAKPVRIPHENLHKHRVDFIEFLSKVRKAYIDRFNKTYDYDIDIDKIYKAPYYTTSVSDLIFRDIINKEMPAHPKNEYAFTRLITRRFVIHAGMTNTGKTYHALQALKQAETGVYLAPLRLLALQVFTQLNDENFPCTLLTGEEEIIVEGAGYVSSTIEKLSLELEYDVAVIDEAQMIADPGRGSAWTRAVLGVRAHEVHICCSENAVLLLTDLITECADSYEIIHHERDTPLIIDETQFHFPNSVQDGDALIAFSKRMVIGIASYLADNNIKASIIYGNLPPETRRRQVELFINKETNVVVSTDAIGMGLNLPIKRIVFMSTEKYDGIEQRQLNAAEIKQISGRAGRKNIYSEGLVNSVSNKALIKRLLNVELSNIVNAYYLPLEKYVLSLPIGTLRERLIETVLKGSKVRPFKGADIEQPLKLLSYIKDSYGFEMSETYSLIFIPFDINEKELLDQWKSYIEAYSGKSEIAFPIAYDWDNIDILETYYKQLDLYYSFCKTMDLPFDLKSVTATKQETADRINALLVNGLKNMSKKCRICGKKLEWNYPYGLCDSCFYKQRYD